MYSGLYAPIKDPGAYLKRIGIEESTLSPDRANLDRIIYAHLTHVPFENLDEYYDKSCPELETEKLFDKIVIRNRGGYCFELNAALYSLLCALGYEAYPVACRIQWGMDHLRPLSHRATIVVIDGVKHYCDVGFGGPSAKCSVPFNETVDGGFYIDQSQRETRVMRKSDGSDELIISFNDTFFEPVDFIPLNYQVSMAPGSYFQMMPMINMTTPTGSMSITGDVFKCHDGGKVTEVKIENEQMMSEYLKDKFGLVK